MNKGKISLIVLVLVAFGLSFYYLKPNSPSETHKHAEEEVYTCPMHPEIRQNHPGTCPICHMKLVKVENKADQDGDLKFSMDISPYQADLVGIKPIKVEKKSVTYTIPVSGRTLSPTSVALQIFENDLRYVKVGVKFEGQSEVFPEDQVAGKVVSVDSLADPSSRTIRVIGRLDKSLRIALSEASFTGKIKVNLGEKIVIPEKAVLFTGKGSFIYLYQDKKLHPKKVSLGPKVQESYVVLDGLSEGELISSGPNFLIDSESKIRGLDDQSHH